MKNVAPVSFSDLCFLTMSPVRLKHTWMSPGDHVSNISSNCCCCWPPPFCCTNGLYLTVERKLKLGLSNRSDIQQAQQERANGGRVKRDTILWSRNSPQISCWLHS